MQRNSCKFGCFLVTLLLKVSKMLTLGIVQINSTLRSLNRIFDTRVTVFDLANTLPKSLPELGNAITSYW